VIDDKPPVQHVVAQLLNELALGADRIQDLQQQGPDQLFRRNTWSTRMRISNREGALHGVQGRIHDIADAPQWMICRDKIAGMRG